MFTPHRLERLLRLKTALTVIAAVSLAAALRCAFLGGLTVIFRPAGYGMIYAGNLLFCVCALIGAFSRLLRAGIGALQRDIAGYLADTRRDLSGQGKP